MAFMEYAWAYTRHCMRTRRGKLGVPLSWADGVTRYTDKSDRQVLCTTLTRYLQGKQQILCALRAARRKRGGAHRGEHRYRERIDEKITGKTFQTLTEHQ